MEIVVRTREIDEWCASDAIWKVYIPQLFFLQEFANSLQIAISTHKNEGCFIISS
jgi:hypothetical protein